MWAGLALRSNTVAATVVGPSGVDVEVLTLMEDLALRMRVFTRKVLQCVHGFRSMLRARGGIANVVRGASLVSGCDSFIMLV